MWFVYLIQCEDQSIYTGITKNVNKRFHEHCRGKGGRYTRTHKPVQLLYCEQVETKREALKREAEIKSWRREKKLNLIRVRKDSCKKYHLS